MPVSQVTTDSGNQLSVGMMADEDMHLVPSERGGCQQGLVPEDIDAPLYPRIDGMPLVTVDNKPQGAGPDAEQHRSQEGGQRDPERMAQLHVFTGGETGVRRGGASRC